MTIEQITANFIIKQLKIEHEATVEVARQHIEQMLAEIRASEVHTSLGTVALPIHQAFCIANHACQNNHCELSNYNLEIYAEAWLTHELFTSAEEVHFCRTVIGFAETHKHKYWVSDPRDDLRYGAYSTAVHILRFWCPFLKPSKELEPIWEFMCSLSIDRYGSPRDQDKHIKAWRTIVELHAKEVGVPIQELA